MSSIARTSAKMTREQQRLAKERGKQFNAALKRSARAAGWGFASSSLFRQSGDWFVSTHPWLLWEKGATTRLSIKPMALDPLFWEIVGLSDNLALPLSFRVRGAWVLRPPMTNIDVGLDCTDVDALAAESIRVIIYRAHEALKDATVHALLERLPAEADLRGQLRAVAVCLHILATDLNVALRLCRPDESISYPLMQDSGGFTTHHRDGSSSTFLEQARDWIISRRRDGLHVVR